MTIRTRSLRVIIISCLVVFVLTFFIFFRETLEIFSSLSAAVLATLLALGTLIVGYWLIRVFSK